MKHEWTIPAWALLALLAPAEAAPRWTPLGEGFYVDLQRIRADDRLPSVDGNGAALPGTTYAVPIGIRRPPEFAPGDPADPAIRQNRLAWDEQEAEYFVHCGAVALVSVSPGRVRDRLRGTPVRSYDAEAGAVQRVLVDYRVLTDASGGADPAAQALAEAGEKVCRQAKRGKGPA